MLRLLTHLVQEVNAANQPDSNLHSGKTVNSEGRSVRAHGQQVRPIPQYTRLLIVELRVYVLSQ